MRPNSHNFRERDGSGTLSKLRSMVRRVVVEATNAVTWRLRGFEGVGSDEIEIDDAEVFDNVGFHARPPSAGRAEVIRLTVGGEPNNIVIIGSRDRQTLDAVLQALKSASILDADETLLHNSKCVVYLKADGTIEAKTPNGTAVALATEDHVHGPGTFANGGGAVTGQSSSPALDALNPLKPHLTSVLKGE